MIKREEGSSMNEDLINEDVEDYREEPWKIPGDEESLEQSVCIKILLLSIQQ